MKNTACIILAAGRGTRMKSALPKVLHRIAGKAMIEYMFELVEPFAFNPVVVVTGYKGSDVAIFCKNARIVRQKNLLGSADAVISARRALSAFKGNVVILYGDTPLIKRATLDELIKRHVKTGASCTFITAKMEDPRGYGRILRGGDGGILRIVEEKEASLYDKVIDEVNVGAYCFKCQCLFEALREVKNNNKKGEYYLTDVVSILRGHNCKIESVLAGDEEEALGINSKEELAKAEKIFRERALKKFLDEGVAIKDPASAYIDVNCRIGRGTVIEPCTIIEKGVIIGADCAIGPFARLRQGTVLADKVEIGNFVELTRCSVGEGTKIKHHTYIGDAAIGKKVNIGAGAITANYDGKNKNKTVIKDGAFIGSGTVFVAPATVGKNAVTGAGSVITKNTSVPDNAIFAGVPARPLKKRRSA